MDYIDLVLMQGTDGFLFIGYAPAWSHLVNGDEVVVDDDIFKVMRSCTVNVGDEQYLFIVDVFGKDIVPVTAKVKYEHFYHTVEIKEALG